MIIPSGGLGLMEPIGKIPKVLEVIWKEDKIIPSFILPTKMLWLMQNGSGKGFQRKRNGNLRQRQANPTKDMPGEMNCSPRGNSWPILSRAFSHMETKQKTDSLELRR